KRRGDEEAARRQGARGPRARQRGRASGPRIRQPRPGNADQRDRPRPRGLRAGTGQDESGARGRWGRPVNPGWSEIFLGVIAIETLTMAVLQIWAFLAAQRLAREAQAALTSVQRDVRPLIAKVQALADDASKTVTLAAAQAQKADRLVTDLSRRVEDTAA